MFANVILPEVPVDQMRGVLSLLTLIANPQAQAAGEFLKKLSEEKDAAAELRRQAAQDRAEAERLLATVHAIKDREILLAEGELRLAEAQQSLARDKARHREVVDAFTAAVAGVKLPAA